MSESRKIEVTIVDVTGNKEHKATLPPDVSISRIIGKLVELMKLPVTAPDGQPVSYKFHHKASGRQLGDDETLEESGVRDGDFIRLQPEITAGTVDSLPFSA